MTRRTEAALSVLRRMVHAEDPLAEYRHGITQLVEVDLRGRQDAVIRDAAEKRFLELRKKEGLERLDKIRKEYAGKEPATQPKVTAMCKPLGWQREPVSYSGSIENIAPPEFLAELIEDPLQQNYRRQAGGKSQAKMQLSAFLGDLARQRSELEYQEQTAKALLCALEAGDTGEPQPLRWIRLDEFTSGALPRRIYGDLETTSWPPRGEQERQAAAKKFARYREWLQAPAEVAQPFEPDNGFYRLDDPLRRRHDEILSEALRKRSERLELSGEEISAAVDQAAQILH